MNEIWVLSSRNSERGREAAYQQVSCDIKSFEGQRRKQLALPQELSKDPPQQRGNVTKVLRDDSFQLEKEWGEHSKITNRMDRSHKAQKHILDH